MPQVYFDTVAILILWLLFLVAVERVSLILTRLRIGLSFPRLLSFFVSEFKFPHGINSDD